MVDKTSTLQELGSRMDNSGEARTEDAYLPLLCRVSLTQHLISIVNTPIISDISTVFCQVPDILTTTVHYGMEHLNPKRESKRRAKT